MRPTMGYALGGAAALLLVAVLWALRGDRPVPMAPVAPAAPSESNAPRAAEAGVDEAPPAPDRVALAGATPDDEVLEHPFAFELDVEVRDRLGLPVEGAKVLLAPIGCRLDEVPGRTDAGGVLRVAWRGRSASMPMVVATTSDETREAMREVSVRSGAPARVVIGGSERRRTRVRLVGQGRDGGQVFNFTIDPIESGARGTFALAIDGIVLEQGAFGDNPSMREGLHPFARFGDVQWPRRPVQTARQGGLLSERVVNLTFATIDLQGPTELPDGGAALLARLEGVVYGEDGRPCAGCPVSWGTAIDRPRGTAQTDADGAFAFDAVPEGALELRAGGGDDGLQHLTVSTLRGQTAKVEVQLRREATVRGQALAADGTPLAGWRVEWVGAQTPWFDACEVGGDGSFVLPNLPGGAGQLLLWRGKSPARLPVAQLDHVRPDGGAVELRFDPATSDGAIQLEPLLPDGVDEAAVEVRVFQEATGRGATLAKVDDSNQFALRGLPAGWYRLELGGPGLGWLDAGRHFVDGKSVFDLGRVAFAASGALRLELPDGFAVKEPDADGGPSVEVYHRRDDCDVRVERLTEGMEGALPLPPGDYLALWRTATGGTGVEPFIVQSGREVAVRCAAPASRSARSTPDGPLPERR